MLNLLNLGSFSISPSDQRILRDGSSVVVELVSHSSLLITGALTLHGPCSGGNAWGYMALAGKDEADDWSSNAKKRQEHFEAETERILMDTYNSLYKCQEFIPQVC